MKKCPSCQKTYDDDNLKFCQTDGTPLVAVADDSAEIDPYKTVVGNQADVSGLISEQDKNQTEAKEALADEPEEDPFKTMVAPPPSPAESSTKNRPADSAPAGGAEGFSDEPESESEEDPMKTMVISGETADNIRIGGSEKKSEQESTAGGDFGQKSEAGSGQTFDAPEPPQFDDPSVELPNFQNQSEKNQTDFGQPKASDDPFGQSSGTPESGGEADKTSSSIPIPSPFDKSMPPGYAPPSTPPFEPPKEPLKPQPLNEPKESFEPKLQDEPKVEPPKSPFAEPASNPAGAGSVDDWAASAPPAPVGDWDNKAFGQDDNSTDFPAPTGGSSAPAADGQNMILAYSSLGLGVLNVTICCGSGLLLGTAAIILGFLARKKAQENPSEYGGEKFALIGMILGGLGIVLSVVIIVLQVFFGLAGSI